MEPMVTAKRLVLENEFARLWFHPHARVVHHQFHKFIWGDAYHEILNTGLELMVREGACKWLSENRLDSVHSRSDTEWMMHDWFPRAVKAGWKYWAVVPPENVIGQMNMERIVAAGASQVEAQFFGDVELALAWLVAAGHSP